MAKKKSNKSKSSKGGAGSSSGAGQVAPGANVAAASTAGGAVSATTAPSAAPKGAAKAASKGTVASGGAASGAASGGPARGGAQATAAVRASRRKKQQRTNLAVIAGVATVVVVAIVLQIVRQVNLPGERFASQGNVHLVSLSSPHVPYNSNPPTSGPHMPSLAGWGSYTEPVEDEYLVHNMEDAGVILWYEMGTPEENEAHVAALEEVSRAYRRIVITPRENLGSQYALTAWTRLQRFDEIDAEAMLRFIDAYEGIDHHPR